MGQAREQEAEIKVLCERGAHREAVERTIATYGDELARFLVAVLHRRELAEEAYSCVCEKLIKNLSRFRWESSLRTWLFRVARNDCMEMLRSRQRREQLMSDPLPEGEAQRERTRTNPWLRTEVKERFHALREQLSAPERALLQLKVEQGLPWTEVAQILWDGDQPPTREELDKRAVALRQQFRRLKDRLRALAVEAGLVSSGDSTGSAAH
ncbi:MAG TPA: sigma-70 family RNA polymerase sigma factor [Myxococcales bacterium]|jgi:RNA polymerase sigma-70 factor (ECF subfamily)|nr:sigma-70 family RNA polymerase sigma factor [Myxococcales bacterium]